MPKKTKYLPEHYDAEDKREAKKHPDHKLIKLCVEFGFVVGGCSTGFEIDPTDNKFAAPMDTHHIVRGDEILTRVAKLKPMTLDGLAAKGAVAKTVIPLLNNYIDEWQTALFRSLAEDTIRLHDLAGGRHGSNPPTRLPITAPKKEVAA